MAAYPWEESEKVELYPWDEGYQEQGDISRGFQTDIGQIAPTLKGAVGLAGAAGEKMFGEGGISTAVKDWGLQGYQEGMKALKPLQKDTDDITVAWEKTKAGDLGAMVDWLQYAIGYGAGEVLQTGVTAATGAVAGGILSGPAAPVGAAGGAVTGAASRGAVMAFLKKSVADQVEKLVGTGMTREAAEAAAPKVIGSTIALSAANTTRSGGSIYGEAEEEATRTGNPLDGTDVARVIGSAIVSGQIETLADRFGINAVFGGIGKGASRTARAVTGGLAVGGVEAGTEAVQTVVERFGARKELTGEEASREYINAAAMGFVPGSGVGAIGGAMSRTPMPQAAERTPGEIFAAIQSEPTVDDAIKTAIALTSGPAAQEADLEVVENIGTPPMAGPGRPVVEEERQAQREEMAAVGLTPDILRAQAQRSATDAASAIRPAVDTAMGEPAAELPTESPTVGQPGSVDEGIAGAAGRAEGGDALTPVPMRGPGRPGVEDVALTQVPPAEPAAVPVVTSASAGASVDAGIGAAVGQTPSIQAQTVAKEVPATATVGPGPDQAQPAAVRQPVIKEAISERQEEALPTGQAVTWKKVPMVGQGIAKAIAEIQPGMTVRQGKNVGTVLESKKGAPPGYLRVQWAMDPPGAVSNQLAAGLQYQQVGQLSSPRNADRISGIAGSVGQGPMFSRTESVDTRLDTLTADKRLSTVKVNVKAIVAETGREAVYEQAAPEALADVKQRLTFARQLQQCLNS